ncbi:hypothetical protein MHLP_01080 [Candidatus Mycoplasma haematolamae str. Purdue]|uniref:Uncharacterized protein n=1 Tax=Mycoplasma haematolamae (strain Purdue) TaxID=1212765 RepID=I7CEW2_MYCHA|nr:hypothetical protein [Candidatus Mycoplasma haematolamae]AFO51796.1 hypothetical protein MHLP_01080 [Candidatus Mycoplasma haematolamae str. Purdue]
MPPVQLGDLAAPLENRETLKAQVGSFKGALDRSEAISSIEEERDEKVKKAQEVLEQYKSHFDEAVKKVKVYLSKEPNSKLTSLSLEERQAVMKVYEAWASIKTAIATANSKLKKLGADVQEEQSSWKTDSEVRSMLNNILWTTQGIKFLGNVQKSGANRSNNWHYSMNWESNPWGKFFESENLWKSYWEERDFLKNELYSLFSLKEQWKDGKCSKVTGVSSEQRELCFARARDTSIGIYSEANIKIELHVAKQVLSWMGKLDETKAK